MLSGNPNLTLEKTEGTNRQMATLNRGNFYRWVEGKAEGQSGKDYLLKQTKSKREDMLLEWKWKGGDRGANYNMENTENHCLEMITPTHLANMDAYNQTLWKTGIQFASLYNRYRRELNLRTVYIATLQPEKESHDRY